jgi:hypothetical protein
MITSVMLARQITLHRPLRTELTPLLRYSCELFVAAKKVNSFGIKQIQALSAKHPGWGSILHAPCPHAPRAMSPNSFPCHTYKKSAPKSFRCHTYKNALPQVLSLPHIRKTRGVPSIMVNQNSCFRSFRCLGVCVAKNSKPFKFSDIPTFGPFSARMLVTP